MSHAQFIRDGVTVTVKNGIVVSEVPLGDGVTKFYHANGVLAAEIPRVWGKVHGVARDWHDNGQLKSETKYVYDMVCGVSRSFLKDGSLDHEMEYVSENAIHGKSYADEGKVRHVYLWNGKPISKSRWMKKIEAAQLRDAALEERLQKEVEAEAKKDQGV